MTDQLEDLFADLRADELTRVRPPGVEAAHRTVHRRRTTKAVGGAAFVAVVAAGGIGSHLLGPLPIGRGGEPDAATLAKRQGRAATAVGLDPEGAQPRSAQGIAAAGIVATELLVAGTYTLRLACAGPGRLTVSFRTRPASGGPGQTVESSSQDCGSAAATTTFTLGANATVETDLRPDDSATERSGYAYRLTLSDADLERLAGQARDRLPRPGARPAVSGSGGPLSTRTSGFDNQTLTSGTYRWWYACAGVGRVQLTVRVGVDVMDGTGTGPQRIAVCDAAAPAQSITFELRAGESFSYTSRPDSDALGQGAYAETLQPV